MPVVLTDHILARTDVEALNAAAHHGQRCAIKRWGRDPRMQAAWNRAAEVQFDNGMQARTRRLLTEPDANHKLAKGKIPAFGLTLFHHVMRSTEFDETGRSLVINACPWAGDCVRMCVINNNRGRMESVRLGWRWRTDFFIRYPVDFVMCLAWSIERAASVRNIYLRPNVNSDVEWETLVPALVDGTIFGDRVVFYGYTKNPAVLAGDGWVTPTYRQAYSWSETSQLPQVQQFIARGGSVAVVTNRRYDSHVKQPIHQWARPNGDGPNNSTTWYWRMVEHTVVDADESDEWIFQPSVIGDLAFKPNDSGVRRWGMGSSFVVKAYEEAT